MKYNLIVGVAIVVVFTVATLLILHEIYNLGSSLTGKAISIWDKPKETLAIVACVDLMALLSFILPSQRA